MEFKEGTATWFAHEIGKRQGQLEFDNNWARLNGGFHPIATAHREKMQLEIEKLQQGMVALRDRRPFPAKAR